MSLQDLYCLAYAPVQGSGLDDIEDLDADVELVQKEIDYLKRLSNAALSSFSQHLESLPQDTNSQQLAVSLHCLSAFLTRLQTLTTNAATLSSKVIEGGGFPEYSTVLDDFSNAAKTSGITLSNKSLEDFIDTDADSSWSSPPVARGRVGFRSAVSIVRSDGNRENGGTVFQTSHEIIKPEYTRRQVRQGTGYAKFSMKDLKALEAESDDDSEVPPSTVKCVVSQQQKSTAVSHGNISTSQVASSVQHLGDPSTGVEDKAASSTFCFGLCGGVAPSDDEASHGNALIRRESSVAMGNVEEIQDPEADKHWSDNSRHEERFSRIRKRVPTGHPSLMRGASDEVSEMLEHLDSEEAREAERLLQNTAANSSSPKLSSSLTPRSVEDESPRLRIACWDDGEATAVQQPPRSTEVVASESGEFEIAGKVLHITRDSSCPPEEDSAEQPTSTSPLSHECRRRLSLREATIGMGGPGTLGET